MIELALLCLVTSTIATTSSFSSSKTITTQTAFAFSPNPKKVKNLCRNTSPSILPPIRKFHYQNSHPLTKQSSLFIGSNDFFDEISEPWEPSEENDNDDEIDYDSVFEDHIPKLNIVTLSGRVGSDPDPRYFDNGNVVLNLSLAVKRKYHPLERKAYNIKYGKEDTDWFTLEMWGRDAEYASKFVTKGARIGITGSLQIDSWTDRNTGEQRTRPKIIVKHLDILETKAEAELRRSNKGRYSSGGDYKGNDFGGDYKGNDFGGFGDDGPPAGVGGFFD